MQERAFKQIDVFTNTAFKGNPLAVIMDAQGLSDEQMLAIARWTNLSETTFVLPATHPDADYQVRIFSPYGEFDFAGHPTLGTAHALLEAGRISLSATSEVIQQCKVGLVTIVQDEDKTLRFQAPAAKLTALSTEALSLLPGLLGKNAYLTNYPPTIAKMGNSWLVIRVPSVQQCLELEISFSQLKQFQQKVGIDKLAIYAAYPENELPRFEFRALLLSSNGVGEDPVTGSANACLARVLQQQLPADHPLLQQGYQVRQGTVLQREGQLMISFADGHPWIGGKSITLIDGSLLY